MWDGAFISRIRWQIEFTLPNEEAREKIWQAQISEQLPSVIIRVMDFLNRDSYLEMAKS